MDVDTPQLQQLEGRLDWRLKVATRLSVTPGIDIRQGGLVRHVSALGWAFSLLIGSPINESPGKAESLQP